MNLTLSIKKQVAALLDLLQALDPATYTKPVFVLSGKSIGQHVRHIIDFYLALIDAETDDVCYDERTRDEQTETNLSLALEHLQNISLVISSLDPEKKVLLTYYTHTEQQEKGEVKSSCERELLYVYDHTVHHMAMIKAAILSEFQDIQVNADFGVSISTIKNNISRSCAH